MALVALKPTRKIALALTPWLVFACSYDWMRLLPNYEVNHIDTKGLYDAEKALFGISTAEGTQIPGEWFMRHNCVWGDIVAGISYLSWVPMPLGFALYLYFKGERKWYLHFSLAFLFVNLVGFIGYYIHPAAPPWYVLKHGFEPILNTPGDVGGLIRFDNLVGIPIFQSIYSGNSNVFAAVPSLHAAYLLITAIYSHASHQQKWVTCLFALLCIGIWFTAVYSGHHYIIDVILGILTTLFALPLLELCIMRIPAIQRFLRQYEENI